MNIFVAVGFENFPFDRLIRVIDEGVQKGVIPPPVLMQIGHSNYKPRFCPWQRFLSFDQFFSNLKKADILVSHAGVGTTLLAFSLGKVPILFPRQAKYREHVDDHQREFAQKMVEQKKILAAEEGPELLRLIQDYDALVPRLELDRGNVRHLLLKTHLDSLFWSHFGPKERRR